MTVKEAIENALTWIETKNGHREGAIYQDLAAAYSLIVDLPAVAQKEIIL